MWKRYLSSSSVAFIGMCNSYLTSGILGIYLSQEVGVGVRRRHVVDSLIRRPFRMVDGTRYRELIRT